MDAETTLDVIFFNGKSCLIFSANTEKCSEIKYPFVKFIEKQKYEINVVYNLYSNNFK